MKAIARFLELRSVLCALIALALLAAPLQFAGPAQASVGVAMADMKCPPKKSCCDMDKPDCAKSQDCFAKCGGVPGLALSDKASGTFEANTSNYVIVAVSLRPHASTPLRRPPRI